jgi:hypothetical protein
VDGSQVQEGNDDTVTNSSGVKRQVRTAKGWEINIQWRDGSTTWNALKDIKDSRPLQMAEHATDNGLALKPAFRWWMPHVLKKRDIIIAKTKLSHWAKMHKCGLEVPKDHDDCVRIDRENGDALWQDGARKEMKTVQPAFKEHECNTKDLIGCQKMGVQFVFDIKLGEDFRRKARLVALGNRTKTPSTPTCLSMLVSRDSVKMALTAAALNNLDVLVCDIEGACLTAKCREKVRVEAGPAFGLEAGKIMTVKMALCRLKSSGAAFRSKLAGALHNLGCQPTHADPDVWLKAAVKPRSFECCDMVPCCVDNVMVISHKPQGTIKGMSSVFKLKGNEAGPPNTCLGVTLEKKKKSARGTDCWTRSPEKHV